MLNQEQKWALTCSGKLGNAAFCHIEKLEKEIERLKMVERTFKYLIDNGELPTESDPTLEMREPHV